jgi:hypothetical protein
MFVILFIYMFATIPRISLFLISFTYMLAGPVGHLISWRKKAAEPNENTSHPPLNS